MTRYSKALEDPWQCSL